MTKELLVENINKGNHNKEQLIAWINCLPRASAKPSENLVGDVYMHSIFKHPYVLLKKKKDVWICGLITSESKCPEILEECNSRFFKGAFITRTLFTASVIEGAFISVYENKAQLTKIYKQLKEILCQH